MDEIIPTKIVKPTISNQSSNVSENKDSAESRSSYDSRLYGDQTLVEQYRHYPLMRFFGLSDDEKADDTINEKVKSVYKWATSKIKDVDPNKYMKMIRYLEMEIGLPDMGVSRLDHISGFISLENQLHDVENERLYKYGF